MTKEIIEKLLTGELEIATWETNNDVVTIPNVGDVHHSVYNLGKTMTITCKIKTPDKDRIKELEEENCELRGKLDSLNEILNPSQDEDYDKPC